MGNYWQEMSQKSNLFYWSFVFDLLPSFCAICRQELFSASLCRAKYQNSVTLYINQISSDCSPYVHLYHSLPEYVPLI